MLIDGIDHTLTHPILPEHSVENEGFAVFQYIRGVILIEKDQGQAVEAIGHGHPDDVQTLADVLAFAGVDHRCPKRAVGVQLQIVDPSYPGAILIGSGKMADQVLEGINA